MMKKLLIGLVICSQLAFVSCSKQEQVEKKELTVAAAASLTDVLEELEPTFEEKYNVDIKYTFGGSGSLMTQIQQHAPIDVFFSAASKQMNTLKDEKLVKESTDLLGNELVLIGKKGSNLKGLTFEGLKDKKDIDLAIGNPESVPAGQYAVEVFNSLGINFNKELNLGNDVRQVLTWVELGEVDTGIIYKTDALTSDKVEILSEAPKGSYKAVTYPVGVVEYSENKKVANEFIEFLKDEESIKCFEKYGFSNLLNK